VYSTIRRPTVDQESSLVFEGTKPEIGSWSARSADNDPDVSLDSPTKALRPGLRREIWATTNGRVVVWGFLPANT